MLINKLLILSSILDISTRLLKTRNVLFRVIKPLLFLANIEALYNYSVYIVKHIKKHVFNRNKRAF
jgi:hypothetical protein